MTDRPSIGDNRWLVIAPDPSGDRVIATADSRDSAFAVIVRMGIRPGYVLRAVDVTEVP